MMWLSCTVAVRALGTCTAASHSSGSLPPLPVKQIVVTPASLAAFTASMILAELPEVEIPINTSPWRDSACTWREKTKF